MNRPDATALDRLRASFVRGLYAALNGLLALARAALWMGPRPERAERVCVFRVGNIGDIVCALPALCAVRRAYPGARLTLLTSPGKRGMPGAAEVLEGVEWIDEVIVYHADQVATLRQRLDFLRGLRARRFDVWLDLPQNLSTPLRELRDTAFAALVAPAWAAGWRVHTLRLWAQSQSLCLDFPDEVTRLLRIVSEAGIPVGEAEHALPRLPAAVAKLDALLGAPGELVALAPGGKRSTNKWPPERFVEVGRHLAAQDLRVVVLGGPGDADDAADIAARIGRGAESFAGRLSVAESCELLRRCRLLVSIDSGAQHLAAAVGTPCVSLFSFWEHIGKWRPHGQGHAVIQKWVPCHTCLLDACPRENECMTEISAPDVLEASRRILSAHVRPAVAAGEGRP